MSEIVSVIEIVDQEAKRGISQKTGKAWSMARVGLSNGVSAFIFNPIEIGDAVEEVINGEFKNWQKLKAPDPKHAEIMQKLDQIISLLTVDVRGEPADVGDDQFDHLEPPEDLQDE